MVVAVAVAVAETRNIVLSMVNPGMSGDAAATKHEAHQASYRERAKQAEALAKQLHQQIQERDSVIRDLEAQLRHPDGTLLADKLRQVTKDLATSRSELARAQSKFKRTNDSLTAARANITYEQERNVARLNPRYGVRSRPDG